MEYEKKCNELAFQKCTSNCSPKNNRNEQKL